MASKFTAATRTSTRTREVPPTTTRTTRARTKAAAATAVEPEPVGTKKTYQRKPLVSKDNAVETKIPATKGKQKATGRKVAKPPKESESEPIMAYLRIRPHIGEEDAIASPYLTPLSDTTVNMTHDPHDGRSKYRFSTLPPSSTYTFSHVFPPNTTQSEFFTKTTLPLVQDVLQGQNALIFTYGVTNSGKTYTVQGGKERGAAGILPRSLDIIFNSIGGLHGDGKYRPARLQGIELAEGSDIPPPIPEPALAQVLGSLDNMVDLDFDVDPTSIKVDRNYEYTVWISYAEVYNEKVYDLLASVKDEAGIHTNGRQAGKSLLLTRQALPLRPAPPSDTMDTECTGKYIAGLRQFRVRSAAEAKSLVTLGQLHRRVFGTLANRESSRSHGMVVLKIVRGHKGERDDPTSLQVSRLTLVDLAGSERTKHTHTSGDRLKEAGNINKSLMVLGQCLEVMRSNQRKVAVSLAQESKNGRVDTRDIKQGLAIVPFRHSKLTEALMDYFVGDGRTVIIVNINPYDTGYDENSHVMKFAALAKEVHITPIPAPVQRVPVVGPGKTQGSKIRNLGPLTLKDPDVIPHPYSRKVHISIGDAKGKNTTEAILEVVEEDEPQDEADQDNGDEQPINPLVDVLFDEVENLRLQLYEAEMRCAFIEAETREEVLREMEERMRKMEEMYSKRLMSEWEHNELKTDAKIDMLHQSGLFGSPVKAARQPWNAILEEDVEMSLVDYGEPDDMSDQDDASSFSLSPLAHKTKSPPKSQRKSVAPRVIVEERAFIPDPSPLPSDTEEAQETELDDDDDFSSVAPSTNVCSEEESTRSDAESYTESEDEEGWEPRSKTPKAKKNIVPSPSPSPTGKCDAEKSRAAANQRTPRVSRLAQDMVDLHLNDSAVILPRRSKPHFNATDEDDDNEVLVKKKKRLLGKRSIATEDEINKLAYSVEKKVAKAKNIKRIGN